MTNEGVCGFKKGFSLMFVVDEYKNCPKHRSH